MHEFLSNILYSIIWENWIQVWRRRTTLFFLWAFVLFSSVTPKRTANVRYCIYTTSNNLRSLSVRSITITPKACIACPANNSGLNGGILALEARIVLKKACTRLWRTAWLKGLKTYFGTYLEDQVWRDQTWLYQKEKGKFKECKNALFKGWFLKGQMHFLHLKNVQ